MSPVQGKSPPVHYTVQPGRGQKYFNIALALQDKRLTIFTQPVNTCTCPKKLYAIKKMGGGGGGGGGNLIFLNFLISQLK